MMHFLRKRSAPLTTSTTVCTRLASRGRGILCTPSPNAWLSIIVLKYHMNIILPGEVKEFISLLWVTALSVYICHTFAFHRWDLSVNWQFKAARSIHRYAATWSAVGRFSLPLFWVCGILTRWYYVLDLHSSAPCSRARRQYSLLTTYIPEGCWICSTVVVVWLERDQFLTVWRFDPIKSPSNHHHSHGNTKHAFQLTLFSYFVMKKLI